MTNTRSDETAKNYLMRPDGTRVLLYNNKEYEPSNKGKILQNPPSLQEKHQLKRRPTVTWKYNVKEKPKEPVLLLIKENHKAEWREGVSEGYLTLDDEKVQDGRRAIILDSAKLIELPYPNERGNIKAWVHYENEATSYPHMPMHDSRLLRRIIERLIMNYKDFERKSTLPWKQILITLAVIAVLFWVLKDQPFMQKILGTAPAVVTNELPPGTVQPTSGGVVVGTYDANGQLNTGTGPPVATGAA